MLKAEQGKGMENCLLVPVFSLTKLQCRLFPNTHTRTLPSPEPSTSSSLPGALPLSGTDHMTDSTPLVIVPFPNLHTSTKMAAIHKQYTSHMFSTADITSDVQGSQRTNRTGPRTERLMSPCSVMYFLFTHLPLLPSLGQPLSW